MRHFMDHLIQKYPSRTQCHLLDGAKYILSLFACLLLLVCLRLPCLISLPLDHWTLNIGPHGTNYGWADCKGGDITEVLLVDIVNISSW